MGAAILRKKALKTLAALAITLSACTSNPLIDNPNTKKVVIEDGQTVNVLSLPKYTWRSQESETITREVSAFISYNKGILKYNYDFSIEYSNNTFPLKRTILIKHVGRGWGNLNLYDVYTYEYGFELEGYRIAIKLSGYVSEIAKNRLSLYILPYYNETLPNKFKGSW